MTPVLCFVGYSGSGKTTLLEKLIAELTGRGVKVATIKHTHHAILEKEKNRDTGRFLAAGAVGAVLVGADGLSMSLPQKELEPIEIASLFSNADIVLCEGFKGWKGPKVEVYRSSTGAQRACEGDSDCIALICDEPMDGDLPVLPMNDIAVLADWIVDHFLDR